MRFLRAIFSLSLAGLIVEPGAAQVLKTTGRSAAPGIVGVAGLPVVAEMPALPLSPLALTPVLAAPALPAPLAVQAQAASLLVIEQAVAPELEALKDSEMTGVSAREAGERVMAHILGAAKRGPTVDLNVKLSGRGARSKPAVSQVAFAEAVSGSHREFFNENLRRRKAGWFRGLAQMGVKLDGPIAPTLKVLEAADFAPGKAAVVREVRYRVEWSQGETRVGAFKVAVRLKDLQPSFLKLPAPPVPEEKQLRVRFLKSAAAGAEEFFESRRLRVLGRHWEGDWLVAVTGRDQADAVSRELSGRGPVLYASPVQAKIEPAGRLRVMFKKKTVVDIGFRVETVVDEGVIAKTLREAGLRVLEAARDGAWEVGALDGVKAEEAAIKLGASGVVLYAAPSSFEAAEERQIVVAFKKAVLVDFGAIKAEAAVSEDDVARVLTANKLLVARDFGAGSYKLQAPAGTLSAAALEALLKTGFVEKGVAVGTLSEQRVRGAAAGTAWMKGRPYSATEYNQHHYYARLDLELAGATQAQLALFDSLTAEAPVKGGGFNSYSGD